MECVYCRVFHLRTFVAGGYKVCDRATYLKQMLNLLCSLREIKMADRKSVTFALPYRAYLKDLKAAIDNEISGEITLFQELGNEEYLTECVAKEGAETLIEQGFDYENRHVGLHPPQSKLVNVSIMKM